MKIMATGLHTIKENRRMRDVRKRIERLECELPARRKRHARDLHAERVYEASWIREMYGIVDPVADEIDRRLGLTENRRDSE